MRIKMEREKIEELEGIVKEEVICPYKDCCSYLEYNQCTNISYLLCSNYEAWVESEKGKKLKR